MAFARSAFLFTILVILLAYLFKAACMIAESLGRLYTCTLAYQTTKTQHQSEAVYIDKAGCSYVSECEHVR